MKFFGKQIFDFGKINQYCLPSYVSIEAIASVPGGSSPSSSRRGSGLVRTARPSRNRPTFEMLSLLRAGQVDRQNTRSSSSGRQL